MRGAKISPLDLRVARVGDWLRDHQQAIRRMQWAIVALYVALLVLPALAPLPTRLSHVYSDVVLFAQFAFWGIWWPFVLVSMILVGRSWCGLFCPEGALAETASAYGLGRATPHWIKWKGWPFVAFAGTTIYGQMVSVYQYPKPVLVVLGGSTIAAIAVGLVYGRNKRVWCRYLCPVNGVFGLLSKLAPLRYRVDRGAWTDWRRAPGEPAPTLNCAPLVPIRTMQGASACHMCGRCSGFKDAIALELRSPSHEIVEVAGAEARPWETALIAFGLMGLAAGAFQWTSSPFYVDAKQALAEFFVARGWTALIEPILPWFVLTNYPDQNDMMTPLDGGLMIAYVVATAAVVGALVYAALVLATLALGRFERRRFHHLAQCLIPIAGCGVFLGLSAVTVTLLRSEGLPLDFVGALRALLLAGASFWTGWLGWKVSGVYARSVTRRAAATAAVLAACAVGGANWVLLFWIW
jgi:polyferredoxin